jgi:hypothetical protein
MFRTRIDAWGNAEQVSWPPPPAIRNSLHWHNQSTFIKVGHFQGRKAAGKAFCGRNTEVQFRRQREGVYT